MLLLYAKISLYNSSYMDSFQLNAYSFLFFIHMELLTKLNAFILATSVTLFIVTFVLKLPHLISNQPQLVNLYYIKNFHKNVPLDFLLIFVYLYIPLYVASFFKIKSKQSIIAIIVLCTTLLTGGFCYYSRSFPMTSSFFSKWFHKAGYSVIVYDIILLVCTYLIYDYLLTMTKHS